MGSWDATHTSHTEAENVEECSVSLGARYLTKVLGTWEERGFSGKAPTAVMKDPG